MIKTLWVVAALLGLPCFMLAQDSEWRVTRQRGIQFTSVDIVIDAGSAPLAAYQLVLVGKGGDVKITGIEGGEHTAFQDAPLYDPSAMQHERVILAAFSTGADLPVGSTRVATVHVQYRNKLPQFSARLTAAASVGGESIPVKLKLQLKNNP